MRDSDRIDLRKIGPKPKRTCGECTVCCTLMAISDVPQMGHKPPSVQCVHVCAKGCGIYETRPIPCRQFRCGYLHGLGSAGDRPDRLGAMFWLDTRTSRSMMVEECAPGGLARQRTRHVISQLVLGGAQVIEIEPGTGGRKGTAHNKAWSGPLPAELTPTNPYPEGT